MNLAQARVDVIDLGEDQVDAVVDEFVSGADDLGGRVDAERHEQVPGSVVVGVVAIDDGDVQLMLAERRAKLVRHHRAGSASAKDDQSFHR